MFEVVHIDLEKMGVLGYHLSYDRTKKLQFYLQFDTMIQNDSHGSGCVRDPMGIEATRTLHGYYPLPMASVTFSVT